MRLRIPTVLSVFFLMLSFTSRTSGQLVTNLASGSYGGFSYLTTNSSTAAITGTTNRGNIAIPQTLTGVVIGNFYDTTNQAWDIPEYGNLTVNQIGPSAFIGNTNLTGVAFPANLVNIGSGAFDGCTNLSSPTFPNSLLNIGDGAFENCGGLGSLTFPDSLTNIDDYAFYGCTNLTSVNFGKGAFRIGQHAFGACYNLTTVFIPQNTALVDSYAFNNDGYLGDYENSSLAIVTVEGGVIGNNAFYSCTNLSTVILGNYVTSIGINAFEYCTAIGDITIPNNVTNIGDGAFGGCSSMLSCSIGNGIKSSGWGVFGGCANLSIAVIHSSDTGDETFIGCPSLTDVTLGAEVSTIGFGTFSQCSALSQITIPNWITSIGDQAFWECPSLYNVVIPNSVTNIGTGAFAYDNLTNVVIPSSVTFIGGEAFRWNTNLTYVCFEGDAPVDGGYPNGVEMNPIFASDPLKFVYHVAGTTGWGKTYDNTLEIAIPTAPCQVCGDGFLEVHLQPSGAVKAGAQWSIDGATWQKSGVVLSNLPAGQYTVQYRPLSGWITPSNLPVSIQPGQYTQTNGLYVSIGVGSMKVTLSPSAAVSAGAAWNLDGGNWIKSGKTVSGIPSGTHLVNFKTVTNWNRPTNVLVNILAGHTTSTSAAYTAVTNKLSLALVGGLGTVSPNYDNAWLQTGNKYSVTAKPSKGFKFNNWSGGTGLPYSVLSTKAVLSFTMQSNLTLIGSLSETSPPVLKTTSPANNAKTGINTVVMNGTATDAWRVTGVSYSVNHAGWNAASSTSGFSNWTATVSLAAGTNIIRTFAQNLGGLFSLTNTLNIIVTNPVVLRLRVQNQSSTILSAKAKVSGNVTSPAFSFGLDLPAGVSVRIEYSADLIHWYEFTNFSGTGGSLDFQDFANTNTPQRFYRAVSP